MRYRFVLQLDAAEDGDADFSSVYDLQTSEVHTRAGLPGASSVGPDNVETYAPILSSLFREIEALVLARIESLGIAPDEDPLRASGLEYIGDYGSEDGEAADRASPGSIDG